MKYTLLLALLASFGAIAQNQPSVPARPRVALVLEGGGALGLAHIGVLEWLEEHRIPIDLVAGTSMGGLVGGLYASGKTPSEIRELVGSIDWPATLRGVPPFRDLSFRRKEDQLAFPNRVELGLRNGVSLPEGINNGHEIGLILDRATLPYSGMSSFDDLPIPFRCVAVELLTGQEKVFIDGDLALALRSTMSIPGVFAPSIDGDKVYVDGGIANNLPVDVAKRMGADIVIAITLETMPVKRQDVSSLLGVIGRTVSVVIAANEEENRKAADVLVPVDLKEFTSTDYDSGAEIINRGVVAAQNNSGVLGRFALSPDAYLQHLNARRARIRQVSPVPAFFNVEGTSRQELADSIEETLIPYLNQPLDTGEFESALTRVVGFGRFERVGYRVASRGGEQGLRIPTTEKQFGPPFLKMNLNIDGTDTDDVRFDLAARLTFLDLGGYRREWRNEIQFGGRYGARTEYYFPFSATSKWFLAPRASTESEQFRIYAENLQIATYRLHRHSVGGDLGINFNRFGELRIGEEVRWFSGRQRIGLPLVPSFSGRGAVTRLQFRYEGLDDPVVARRGFRVNSTFEFFAGQTEDVASYPQLTFTAEYYQPVTRSGSVFATANAHTTFGTDDFLFPPFSLGGPRIFGAYGENEILAKEAYYGTLGWVQEIMRLPPTIGDRIFALGFYQTGAVDGILTGRIRPQSATGLLVLKTFIGPLFIGGSVGDNDHRRWYFGLGRTF